MRLSNKMKMQFLALQTYAGYRNNKIDLDRLRESKKSFLKWVFEKFGEKEQEECDFYFWMFLQNLDS